MTGFNQSSAEPAFVELFLQHQRPLYAFILRFVHDHDVADDLLQKTGVVLWRKFAQFEPDTDFQAWARQIAKYEVQSYLKVARRSRVSFDTATIESLCSDDPRDCSTANARRDALRRCLEALRPVDRELVRRCYAKCASIREIAAELGRSAESVYQSLRRIRHALLQCIERRVAAEDHR